MQIVVLGMHRSGTSLVTRLINMMGAYFASEGASIGFNEENPKGFWERRDVISVNDALLALRDCTWDDVAGWSNELPPVDAELEKRIKNTVLELDAHRPWLIKDPRLCLTLACWKPYLEVPLAVVMHRDPLEIARSLQTRNGMDLHEGIALWEYYTAGMLNASADLKRLFIRHNDFMSDPVNASHSLYTSLREEGVQGLRLPSEQEITAFVEPKYYRSRIDAKHEQFLTQSQLTLLDAAQGAPTGSSFSISPNAQNIMASYRRHKLQEIALKQERQAQIAALEHTRIAAEAALAQKESSWLIERESLAQKTTQIEQTASGLLQENQRLQHEISAIKQSSSWKLGHRVIGTLRTIAGK